MEDIIKELDVKNVVLNIDDGSTVLLIKPERVGPLPTIDTSIFKPEYYLTSPTPDQIRLYFNSIISKEYQLNVFNGLLMCDFDHYVCDYCNYGIAKYWYYCNNCYKDMCKVCYSELNDEHECKNHNIVLRDTIDMVEFSNWRACNECHEYIDDHNILDSDGKIVHKCYYTGYDAYDICIPCYEANETIRNEKQLKFIDPFDPKCCTFYYAGLKSMLYWFPILEDGESCRVLINLNLDDENYGKLCLQSFDDCARMGYYMIYDETLTLDVILQRLKTMTDKGTFESEEREMAEGPVYGDGYDEIQSDIIDGKKHSAVYQKRVIKEAVYQTVVKDVKIGSQEYSSPIQLLMRELNMKVYYG
jgi:hypothetical protein